MCLSGAAMTGRRKTSYGKPASLGSPGQSRDGAIMVPVEKRYGARASYEGRPARPMTDNQAVVYNVIGSEPVSQRELRKITGMSKAAMASVIGGLQLRALIYQPVPRKWARRV